MYDLVDMNGNIIGTIDVEGGINPDHLGYALIAAADTDKSFTFELGDKKWTGIKVRHRKI